MKRTLRIGVLLLAVVCALSGCLLNSPSNVTKRFVGAIRSVNWDKMERLVDWPSTERAFGRSLEGTHKETLLKIAERITDYPIGYEGDELARTKFLYIKVTKTALTKEGDDRALVRATVRLDSESTREVVFATSKVGRTWRVVLTPNLLER
jgi:hypothetical protein